jgi:Mn-dependent DtxR family transcriptional regulator
MTTNKKRWTEIEKNFLTTNAATMKDSDMANHLKKSLKSIREMRRRLGMVKLSGRGKVQLRESVKVA